MDVQEYERMFAVEDTMWWYVGMREIVAAWLKPQLAHRPDARILDAGCGTGANLIALKNYGTLTAVDLAPQALQLAAQRGDFKLGRTSITELPFASGSFDGVFSADVLVMLTPAQTAQAMREFARVLKPGGWLYVRTAAYDWLRGQHDDAWSTQHRFTALELAAQLTQAGLTPARLSYANTLLFPVAAAKRMLERVMPSTASSDTELPSPFVNRLLIRVLGFEAKLLQRSNLPFGLSVMALASKPNF